MRYDEKPQLISTVYDLNWSKTDAIILIITNLLLMGMYDIFAFQALKLGINKEEIFYIFRNIKLNPSDLPLIISFLVKLFGINQIKKIILFYINKVNVSNDLLEKIALELNRQGLNINKEDLKRIKPINKSYDTYSLTLKEGGEVFIKEKTRGKNAKYYKYFPQKNNDNTLVKKID